VPVAKKVQGLVMAHERELGQPLELRSRRTLVRALK